jgi:hypothetical protein
MKFNLSASDTSLNSEQGMKEFEETAARLEKGASVASSFPVMPAGLAKKLGVVDRNVVPSVPAPSQGAPSLGEKGKEKMAAVDKPTQLVKFKDATISGKGKNKQEEKENKKASSSSGLKKPSSSGGARRVPVPAVVGSSKSTWR